MRTLTKIKQEAIPGIIESTEEEYGELTVIHFITRPNPTYSHGWWVELIPSIYIRSLGKEVVHENFGLVYAYNIPIAPKKHYFKSLKEELHFTLFFPALPKAATHINVVEMPGGSIDKYFNFYSLPIEKINREALRHH